MNAILIDNHDSFTHNLEHLLAAHLGHGPEVVCYDDLPHLSPVGRELIIISPGPGRPAEYPGYGLWIDSGIPVLGICLGLQIINEHFGGRTDRLQHCVHGKTEDINFLGQTQTVARYHSLYCSNLGTGLEVIAANTNGVPMALAHRNRPIMGYQFHPESFLTKQGGVFIDHALQSFGIA
ncbi:anthranilate synthase component II [Desulfovibrio ferrophilus]|uniref:Anthranilate synthase component II n=1 Tax=Desulfovibrio ferrophilus TaxID=241368 RepID=A0A2Z6AXW6_9BACT|nr:aminodeoxychorismate/anthranilate synthase component II [Desulfovibrio ferrophilus]BBD08050.1 anthranilate synthase component II [Desulfovibrio ferrophilus]